MGLRLICQAAVSSTLMFISDGPQSTVAFDMPNHSKTILLSAGKRHGNGRKGNVAGLTITLGPGPHVVRRALVVHWQCQAGRA